MNKTVINKGYTLTVTSWENDYDNHNVLSKTVETIQEAKAWYDMMMLCKSKNNRTDGSVGLGNSGDTFNNRQLEAIKDLFKEHPIFIEDEADFDFEDDDLLQYHFCDLSSNLLGHSEYYSCRVMESCDIIYSPVDVTTEDVTMTVANYKNLKA